ncbi:uncharacterized protein F4822DRAFT_410810 [Hypoxylon trugodes]|uniref:uncharacterized protein n=1 Tax=Hypoxylon trugodes TaxID=326681 RepID=UPI00219C8534|nr:uncharacterized protein F4822DRAFT_410810 [Hypoxylon trugodes]KAI1386649.1 hypothetical protein F4822DRAFT_410810 [Hypoxylon trugodes]
MEKALHMNAPGSQSTSNPALGSGRACTNCARVKCKCIYRPDGITCERCHRLKKECAPSISLGRRGGKQRVVSRTARLEEKLDELVTRLKTQQGAPKKNTEDEPEGAKEPAEIESDAENASAAAVTPATATNSLGGTTLPNAATPDSSISHPDEPLLPEAEELLKRFREETIGFFPFVYIPPHVTSQQLRELYPFLWLNIMCITMAPPKRRVALGDQARSIAIQKVAVEREKSLDLLLGLLTLVGWAHLQRKDKPFYTLFSQFIVTLVSDLGLHKPPPDCQVMFCGPGKDHDLRTSNLFRRRTHEEQRAVLGAFVITTMVSSIFRHAPGLRWSAHLDSYVSNLAQDSTVTQDQTLIAQVRMQLIINQLYDDSWPSGAGGAPPALYISALRSQLRDITRQEKLGTAVRNHPMILELYHFTDLLINESAISKQPNHWNEPDLQRFEIYQNCLVSIKSFLDTYFSIPITLLKSMPFTSHPQLVRVMGCLHMITTVQDPAWDRAAVRRSVDLIPTCDKIIGTFEYLRAAPALATSDGGEDESYNWGLSVFRKMRAAWQNELANMDATNETSMIDGAQTGGFATTMDFTGDPWFSEMLNNFWE